MHDVVCLRKERGGGCMGIAVDLNHFMGMARVQLVDDKQQTCEDMMQRVGETVQTVPESWTVKIGEVESVSDPFEVDWELVEIALNKPLQRQIIKPPQEGTIQFVHRCSSPLPKTNFDRASYQLKKSEVPTKSKGLYPLRTLPSGHYVGEFLGERVDLDKKPAEGMLKVFQRATHDDDGAILHRRPGPALCYLDGRGKNKSSSFVSFVNQAMLWPKRFKVSAVGNLTAARPGVANAEFVQVQDRLYLRTTRTIPPQREILYEPWKEEEFTLSDKQVLAHERLMNVGTDVTSEDESDMSSDLIEKEKKKSKKKTPQKKARSSGGSTGSKKDDKRKSVGSSEKKKKRKNKSGEKDSPKAGVKRQVSFGSHAETPPAKARKSSLKKN